MQLSRRKWQRRQHQRKIADRVAARLMDTVTFEHKEFNAAFSFKDVPLAIDQHMPREMVLICSASVRDAYERLLNEDLRHAP